MSPKPSQPENKPLTHTASLQETPLHGIFPHDRLVEYLGLVGHGTNERVLGAIKDYLADAPEKEIYLLVTSAGGPTGAAMSLYDTVRYLLKPNLVTIGSGDVDSSGVIIFLMGEKRYITKHTTLLLHLAGRTFEGGKRMTAADLESMAAEDRVKDTHYADVVAENSRGKLTSREVLEMMAKTTLLTPEDMVALGLADGVLA